MAYTTINKHTDYFNTKLYTGTGSSNSITGVGFNPDLVWIKDRGTTFSHTFTDKVRGTSKEIYANGTAAETVYSQGITSFDSDGFTLGTDGGVNSNGGNKVSWNWKAGGTGSSNSDGSTTATISADTTVGFSIVSWTGTGSATTLGHGLSATPQVILVKNRSEVYGWQMYHPGLGGNNKYISINSTDAVATDTASWNNTAPTSSVFSVGASDANNKSGNNIIAYCFVEKKGYSKFGKYTGNGSTDGTFIYTGFKPSFLIMKRTDTTGNWLLYDNKRDVDNPTTQFLAPNSSQAEQTLGTTNPITDFLSNGFKLRGSGGDGNASGGTIIYMAFGQSLVGSNNIPCTAR